MTGSSPSPRRRVTNKRSCAGRQRRRGIPVLLGLGLLCLFAACADLLLGGRWLSPGWLTTLFADAGGNLNILVIQARLPRMVVALLVGMGLAIAGCVIQALCRNPLADPGLLGVNAGASASLVTLGLFPATALWGQFWQALPGALLASVFVLALSRAQSGTNTSDPTRLILAGAAISAALGAYVQGLVVLNPTLFNQAKFWLAGSLSGMQWQHVNALWPYVLPTAFGLWLFSPALNTLALGRDTATALGANKRWQLAGAWLGATVLSAAATAVVGPLAFVGLSSAHLARRILPQNFRLLIPGTALIGATLVVTADMLARTVLAPVELLTGIMIAVIGAPFLYLVARQPRSRAGA